MIMPLNNVIITLFQIETIREILLPNYYKHRKETMAHLMGFLFHRMIIQSDHIFNIEPYIEYVTKCLEHYSLRMDSEDMFNTVFKIILKEINTYCDPIIRYTYNCDPKI
eukprot:861093_1